MLFSKKVKRGISILSLACFLGSPLSYTLNMSTAAAATTDAAYTTEYASDKNYDRHRHDRDDKWNKNDRDDRWNKDDRDDKWSKEDREKWEKERQERIEKQKKERQKAKDKWEKEHRKDKDDDGKDFSRGDITTAVLIGGVIGAIIAKNT